MNWIINFLRKRKMENLRMECIRNFKIAKEDLQPLVFEGVLYIAYRGNPIIEANKINGDIVDEICNMQITLGKYLNSKIKE